MKCFVIVAIATLILGGSACINPPQSELRDIQATVEIKLLEEKTVLSTVQTRGQISLSKQQDIKPDQSMQSTSGSSLSTVIIPPYTQTPISPVVSTAERPENPVHADPTTSTGTVPIIAPTLELPLDNDPYHHMDQANILLDAGENKEAISKLTFAISLFPEHGATYASHHGIPISSVQISKWFFLRGQTYYKIARYNDAISDFDQALKLSPSYASAWFHLGKSREQLAQPQQARQAFDKACLLDYRWCIRSTVIIPPQVIPTITPTPYVPTPTTPYIPPTPTPRPGYCSAENHTNPHTFFGVAGENSIIEARLSSVILATTTAGLFKDYRIEVPVCDSSGKSLSGRNIHFKVNDKYAANTRGTAMTVILSAGSFTNLNLCGVSGVEDC